MVTNDSYIVDFKHRVITEICRLAWADRLNEETKEALVKQLIPGPKPAYRCCIYKEREIVRDRIRLACNLTVDENMRGKVVQVIEPACHGCPPSSYIVTDNCRFCMGRACLRSCHFGALHPGGSRMHIDKDKCKKCGQCAQACPYGAILRLVRPCQSVCPVGAITYDENDLCVIDREKCVECGQCIHTCPYAAIASRVHLVDVIRHIKAGDEVIAMCAPATEGQYEEKISMAAIRAALKKVGFKDMVEVGLGGDMTAAYEALEWAEAKKEGHKMTTSCCPAFVKMVKLLTPEVYENNLSQTVSPMCGVSRYLKTVRPGCVTVFIGPCIAKKSEAEDKNVADNADYALTYGEMGSLLESRGVELEPVEEDYQEASLFGKSFASSGGVTGAVLESMKERGEDTDGVQVCRASGGAECKKALLLLRSGKLSEDFIEGMACEGGCLGGPSKHREENEIRRARRNLMDRADRRGVIENLERYPMERFSMRRDGAYTGRPRDGK